MNTADVIFSIQRFSLHDGPGIRTTVFLKGCPMHCSWCHNPEGQHPDPEIRYFPDRCIACGQCVIACPNHAHELHDGVHVFLRDRCQTSGKCVETCCSQALQLEGRRMTVPEVMDEVLRDKAFYETSGGGVTLSGGEPALSADFARSLLEECKHHNIHTAIETCGECPWTSLEALLPATDLIMMDLKEMAAEKHRISTGQSNVRILSNARQLALTDKKIIFRTPVVPTVNDSEEDISQIACFVRELTELRTRSRKPTEEAAAITYELMAFHKLASDKYRSLGLEYAVADIDPPPKAKMSVLLDVAKRCGVQASIR
jgi:pyruvate formate lyase activating enzyme